MKCRKKTVGQNFYFIQSATLSLPLPVHMECQTFVSQTKERRDGEKEQTLYLLFLRSYKFGPVLLIKTILRILNLFLSFIATLTDAKDWDGLKPILYLLSFYKAKDLPSRHHLNSKTNGPVLLIKIVFRLWPVANDGKPVEID